MVRRGPDSHDIENLRRATADCRSRIDGVLLVDPVANYSLAHPTPLGSAMALGVSTAVGEMTPALTRSSWFTSGAGPPSAAPTSIGLRYWDTTNSVFYKATGVAVPEDWILDVASVNGYIGAVVLDPDDLDDTATTNKFTDAAGLAVIAATSGANTGDQNDHGGLNGLADDDHTQYHNDARATTWLAGRQATTSQLGVVELATTTEAEAGVDTLRGLTPASIANLIKRMSRVYAVLQTEGTGAPTLEANSLGVASVSRTGIGLYTFTFSGGLGLTANAYTAVLGANISTSAQFFVAKILTRTAAVVTIEVRNASTLAPADGGDWPLDIKASF